MGVEKMGGGGGGGGAGIWHVKTYLGEYSLIVECSKKITFQPYSKG